MIDSVFSILGLDPTSLAVPDTALLVVAATIFIFSMDWIFKLIYLVIGTLTKRR